MPTMPKTLGSRGASALRVAFDKARREVKASRGWYSSARWQKLRMAHLVGEPWCCFCEAQGVVVAASVADHVEPHRENAVKFWEGRLQSLCASCHSSDKQRIERGILQR